MEAVDASLSTVGLLNTGNGLQMISQNTDETDEVRKIKDETQNAEQ